MLTNELHFQLSDLSPDWSQLNSMLGYPDGKLPQPFDLYLAEALQFAAGQSDMSASCRLFETFNIDPQSGLVSVGGETFGMGKTICKELKYSEGLIFFVATAGKSLSNKASSLAFEEDPVKGYIYDQLGIFVTEAIGDCMQQQIRQLLPSELKMTNRYSPGYCHWEVADQQRLFSLLGDAPAGVTLTDAYLMDPVKSISGVMGIGKAVRFREYPCALCQSINCHYRRVG